jgi:mono/diheme cytochrome c family protein
MNKFVGLVLAVATIVALPSCQGGSDEVVTTQPPTAVEIGWTVYGRSCAGCHGKRGGGVPAPALVGSKANLARFGSAQALLDFVQQEMPVNRPGELSLEEYQQLLVLLLLENGIVKSSTEIDFGDLASISLR